MSGRIASPMAVWGAKKQAIGLSEQTEAAGLGRGGDCGMEVVTCDGDWCLMQIPEFEAWIEKSDVRLK